jgi:predicted metal-binding membrane protein
MWLGMMLAMMAPVGILLLRAYARLLTPRVPRAPAMAALGAGYFGVWSGFAIVLGVVHAALQAFALVNEEQRLISQMAAGVLLALAGIYQISYWKETFAEHCRQPREFLFRHWRDGVGGALGMGALYGVSCVCCSWLLVAALFSLGVVNAGWMALVAAIVLAERSVRVGPPVTTAAGAAAILYAGALIGGA